MAIDNENDRRTLLGLHPVPDGEVFSRFDRRQFIGLALVELMPVGSNVPPPTERWKSRNSLQAMQKAGRIPPLRGGRR